MRADSMTVENERKWISRRRNGKDKAVCLGTALIPALVIVFLGSSVVAQTLPLGGRTASMGGAGTASGRDAAMPYINPAGYAQVPHHTLSLSASLYRHENVIVDDFFYHGVLSSSFIAEGYPEVYGNDLVSKRFSSFPGAVNMLWHFGPEDNPDAVHHVLSATIIIPGNTKRTYKSNFSLFFPDTNLRFDDVQKEVNEVTDYLFGPTYSVNFGKFRLGLSAFVSFIDVLRMNESTNTYFVPVDDGTTMHVRQSSRLYSEGKSFGLQPVLGFQWNPVKGFSVGASVASPTIHLSGEMDFAATFEASGPPPDPQRDDNMNYYEEITSKSDLEYRRPLRIRLGLSYEKPKSWAVALDGSLKLPQNKARYQRGTVSSYYLEQGEEPVTTQWTEAGRSDSVLGFSAHLGGEYFFNDMFAWRLGGFYEQGTIENKLQNQDVLSLELDYIGVTTGLGIESELGETTFGIEFAYGTGSTVTRDAFAQGDINNVIFRNLDVSTYNFFFFISGAFDLEEFEVLIKAARNPKMLLGEAKEQLKLADLDASLLEFQDDPVVMELMRDKLLSYPTTEIPEFDTVFKRVARIRASMGLAVELLAKLETQIVDLRASLESEPDVDVMLGALLHYVQTGQKGVMYERMQSLPQVERTVQLMRLSVAIKKLLQQLGSDLAALPADVQRLIEKAPERFAGPDAIMLPAVARSLGAAEADLVAAAKELPALIEALGGVLEALKADTTESADDFNEESPAPESTEDDVTN
ncbi:MAG: UPF0164 family protein [Deltaproteobacteria bacterium]|nr:UPF0164 family protein [Deltaproteobacteria bacterium]